MEEYGHKLYARRAESAGVPAGENWDYAGVLRRYMARWLDWLLLLLMGAAAALAANVLPADLRATALDTLGVLGWPLIGLYFVLFTGLRGQTPGKKALKVKVIDGRGNAPGLWRALLRETLGVAISYFLPLSYLWAIWDKKKQTFHDKIAGTYVILAED